MEIIDSHVHVGLNQFFTGEGVSRFPFDLENHFQTYYHMLRNAKIDKACILPIPAKDFDTTLSHRYLEEAAAYSEGAFLPVCRLDAALANHLCGNFVAGKLHRVYDDLPPKSLHLYLKMLAYYKRPLILHAQFKNKVKQVKDFLKIAPRLVIVLAHMGRGHIYTSEQVVENLVGLAEEKNVFFETSTVGNSATIGKACEIVGSQRVMFGSDYPFGKLHLGARYAYEEELDVIRHAKITKAEKDHIFSHTAQTVFLANRPRHEVFVTLYQESYKEAMYNLLNHLNSQDRKFLALDKKLSIIKDCMRKNVHLFIIVAQGQFAGYLRESGRHGGVSLLEEIVVLPKWRGKGVGRLALDFYQNMYLNTMAKTNAHNSAMIHLLESAGYRRRTEGKRIIDWVCER